jgi:hypothetical protein
MKKILIICIIWLLGFHNAYADETLNNNWVSVKIEKIFSNFTSSYEKKYSKNKTLTLVKKLEWKLSLILESRNISGDKLITLDSLLKISREYLSKDEYNKLKFKREIILNQHKITKDFSIKILDRDDVFLENNIWYTYIFKSHLAFPSWVIPTTRDLDYNKINTKDHLVFITDDNLVWFVKDFKKVKLISDSIIYWIPNKLEFLKEIRDDKKSIQVDTDNDFKSIKEQSKNITKWLYKNEDKIAALYKHVLNNVSYTQPISLEDKKIFSGIETYNNKDWVCEGYVKYFQYLLQFSWIKNVESIRGYVIDAKDYPNIWHAWTKIGDSYYDPTFDDPIGQTETKIKEDYIFYKLPKDLFYTNRYDYWNNNEVLEKAPLNYRKQYIRKQLVTVYSKYKNTNFNILKDIKFRDFYNIDYYKDINLELLKLSIWYSKVKNFTFTEDNKKKRITKLNFYTLTNSGDINIILKQLNYDLSWHKLLEWEDDKWNITYRLWFDLKY